MSIYSSSNGARRDVISIDLYHITFLTLLNRAGGWSRENGQS